MSDSTAFKLEAEVLESRAIITQLKAELTLANTTIEQLKVRIDELHSMAMEDPLTGAANLRALDLDLERRKQRGDSFCLARIDIDSFKAVNSRFTQSGGNKVLIDFTSLLEGTCRSDTDKLYRDGGDEFTVVMHNTTAEQGKVLLRRMRVIVSQTPIELLGSALTFSYGIAEYKGQALEELQYEADKMMQVNKEAAKGCRPV